VHNVTLRTCLCLHHQENNKQATKSRITSPKGIGRKSKSRISKSKQDANDVHKGEIITDNKPVTIAEPQQPQVLLAQMQQQSLGELAGDYRWFFVYPVSTKISGNDALEFSKREMFFVLYFLL